MKKGKRLIALLVILALLGGAAFGGATLLRHRGGEVNVYPAESFITGADWATSAQTDGVVSTDRIQSVYLSSTQVVTQVYVKEGQTVKAGDPILAFDTTLSELSLYRQGIKVDQLKLDIQDTEKQLREIDTYRIGSGGGGDGYYGGGGYSSETEKPVPAPGMPFNRAESALGTQSDPLIFLWNDKCVFSADFISRAMTLALANRNEYLYGDPGGPPMPVDPTAPTNTPAPTDTPEPTATPTPTPTPTATAAPTDTPTPTATATAKPVETATPTPAPTETATPTPAPTDTPEPTETATPTPAPTDTPEPTETATPTPAPTDTPEPTETDTPDPGTDGEGLAAPRPAGVGGVRLRAVLTRRHSPAEPESSAAPEPTVTPVPSLRPDLDPALVKECADGQVYVVFETREDDAVNGEIRQVWELVLSVDPATGAWSFRVIDPVYDPGDGDESEELDDGGYDNVYFDDTVYYEASEIAQMRAEATQKLKDLNLELKVAELEYERLEYELNNGEVYARIDGVVKTLRDPDESRQEKKPMVLVSGGGGYYVTAVLGEFELDTMAVGDTVTVQSWESGEQVEGAITEISEYPDESGRYWYYSEGNQNVSKYPFKVFVNEDASLREGEGVTLSYSASGAAEGSGLFLELPFVRQENGKSFIYVQGGDGLLEKRFVKTGQNLWGSYIEILEGLAEEDYIAFPYGRQTVDGAKTRIADTDELYSSMYY